MTRIAKITITQEEASEILKHITNTINLGVPFKPEQVIVDWTEFFNPGKEGRKILIEIVPDGY